MAAGYGHSLAVKSDGTLWAWGLNDYGQLGKGDNVNRNVPTQVGGATDWVSVFCGSNNSYAVNASGAVRLGLQRLRAARPGHQDHPPHAGQGRRRGLGQ